MEWEILEDKETSDFINSVKDPDFADLFEGKNFELHARDLSFFAGYKHYTLFNKAMLPYFPLDYISNGENHYYLDGSEHPLELLSDMQALCLSIENVTAYLDFYSSVTFTPKRRVKFLIDLAHLPYSGASAMGHHFRTLKYSKQAQVRFDEVVRCFYINLPVLHNGETKEGLVQVMENGEINIGEPIKIRLMDRSRQHEPLHYSHPHAAEVLAQNLDVLRQSPTGQALMTASQERKDKVVIMSGVEHSVFSPCAGKVYVIVPQNIETYSPYQLIDIAGALKDLDLRAQGYARSLPEDDEAGRWGGNAAYNLEIVIELCKITEELVNAGFKEVEEKFRRDGYEDFYSAYKNKADKDIIMDLILDTMYEGTEG